MGVAAEDLVITADDLIKVALAQIGTKEGKNGVTKYGQWYAKRHNAPSFANAAWCDMSVCWIAYEAGRKKNGEDGAESALKQTGDFAFTPYHADWFAQRGRFGNVPHKGAFVFFDWGGSKRISAIDHIGIVLGRTADGRIATLEGNTSNAYLRRYRSPSVIAGYGYPFYATPAPVKVVKPASDTTTRVSDRPRFPLPTGHWFGVESADPSNHSGAIRADKPKVKQAQELLNAKGYTLSVDGEYGPKTRAAVIEFQKDKGLKPDGEIGIITWSTLTAS